MVSMCKIAHETEIIYKTVRRIVKEDLKLNLYKLQKVQLLTTANKRVRLERCQHLLRRHAPLSWNKILFIEEKLFTVEQFHHHQNDMS